MIEQIITAETFTHVAVPLLTKFKDVFRPEAELVVEWVGPSYYEVVILWGAITVKGGEARRFIIRGKRGFCEVVAQQLAIEGTIKTQKLLRGD